MKLEPKRELSLKSARELLLKWMREIPLRLVRDLSHPRGKVVMAVTLLYDQASHRSEVIWRGEDPRCLECTDHFQTLRHWPMDERLLLYIEVVGFGALIRVQWLRLDKPLITSLVERWRSETNTFQLAYGEMTITQEDVSVLLALHIGLAVIGLT
ncbi:hypothetical protein H6P81_017684 [Aristolochia fimbriata]|uniref:Aminotransferase-like plant mobile domain-containing protein n=1 Tax=Aristolochia fimbriata TaxID=158543 RepID=A0AAV7DZ01_ARIFI|nr:hypothetical protein H6P81_017684 [Aristolochia fimbriata]